MGPEFELLDLMHILAWYHGRILRLMNIKIPLPYIDISVMHAIFLSTLVVSGILGFSLPKEKLVKVCALATRTTNGVVGAIKAKCVAKRWAKLADLNNTRKRKGRLTAKDHEQFDLLKPKLNEDLERLVPHLPPWANSLGKEFDSPRWHAVLSHIPAWAIPGSGTFDIYRADGWYSSDIGKHTIAVAEERFQAEKLAAVALQKVQEVNKLRLEYEELQESGKSYELTAAEKSILSEEISQNVERMQRELLDWCDAVKGMDESFQSGISEKMDTALEHVTEAYGLNARPIAETGLKGEGLETASDEVNRPPLDQMDMKEEGLENSGDEDNQRPPRRVKKRVIWKKKALKNRRKAVVEVEEHRQEEGSASTEGH